MTDPSAKRPINTWIRRLIETYTPDGAVGRLGLSAVTGPVGIYALMLAFGFLVNPWIGSLLLVPVAAAAGVFLTIVTVLTLWPLYLSAIGQLESPSEYPGTTRDDRPPQNNRPHRNDLASSPTERLKTEYEQGTLSEAEFERELEAALEEEDRSDDDSSARRTTDDSRVTETERSG